MFDINLYTFSKKPNSTKQPTGSGRELSIHSWDSFDILSPVLWLDFGTGAAGQPYIYNYAYIEDLNRYYYIKTWECAGGLWKAYLEVDALASWKTQIGQQSLYVVRASNEYDGDIKDNMYPITTDVLYYQEEKTNPWRTAIESQYGGTWIMGIIGAQSTEYYVFNTYGKVLIFMQKLLSDDYFEQVIGALGLSAYPEAKVAVDPLQYISSCRWYPMQFDTSILSLATSVSVGLGDLDFTAEGQYGAPYTFNTQGTLENVLTEFIPDKHPQSTTRGAYLNSSPYSSYNLILPPFGIISLDPAIVGRSNQISANIVVDARTGTGELFISARRGTSPNYTYEVIGRCSAPIGVNYPLSTLQTPGYGAGRMMSDTAGVVANALTLNIPGAISAGNAAISNAVYGNVPHLSTVPGVGNVAAFMGTPALAYEFHYIADEDNTDRGRPLCKVRTISTLGGYVQCSDPDISIACTQGEKETLVAALSGGIHFE